MRMILMERPQMPDRFYALNVFLHKPASSEDAAAIISAIKLIKGVFSVQPLLSHPELYWAKEKARSELSNALWEALNRDEEEESQIEHRTTGRVGLVYPPR